MSLEQAIEGMLQGVGSALRRLKGQGRLENLYIVECDKNRWKVVKEILDKISKNQSDGWKLHVTKRQFPKRRHRREQSKPANLDTMTGSRITIERDRDIFRFSAIREQAVIPVREIRIQSSYAEGAAELLKGARSQEDQEKYGKLLHSYLMPEDFQDMIDATPLTLMVDRSTAVFPWEMAAFERHGKTIFYGPGRRLTRQFRTILSGPPGLIAPPIPNRLRVLIIADPAPEADLQLPGARAEGRAVVQVLRKVKEEEGLDITIEQRIGSDECDPVELLALILSEEFDLIHYSGHGDFDEKIPPRAAGFSARNTCFPPEIFSAHGECRA